MKKIILLILILNSVLFSDIILKAVGTGSTIGEAKKDALNIISQNLFTEVKSTIDIENYKDEFYNYNFGLKDIRVNSNMVFQKMKYKILNNKPIYKVEAIFDRDSLIYSIKYLISETNFDYSSIRNKHEFETQEQNLKMLSVLYPYILNRGKRLEVRDYIVKKKDILYKTKNLGYIYIYFTNPDIDGITILINNKIYPANTKIYLEKGIYEYLIKKDGYYDVIGKVVINNRSKLNRKISLHKKTNLKFNLFVDNIEFYDIIKDKLTDNHIKIVSYKTNNSIKISVKKRIKDKSLYGMQIEDLIINIELYKNNKLIFTKKYKKLNSFLHLEQITIDNILKHFIDVFFEKV
jgi:hypothetical protein